MFELAIGGNLNSIACNSSNSLSDLLRGLRCLFKCFLLYEIMMEQETKGDCVLLTRRY